MQKNSKNYTFLLSHTTKSKIYIRRIEISKKFVNSSVAAILLTLGIGSAGFVGFSKTDVLAKNETPVIVQVASLNQSENQISEPKSIDYSRPEGSGNFTVNSGGPILDVQATEEEAADSENVDFINSIKELKSKMSSDFTPNMWAHLGKINNEFGFRRNPFGGRNYEFHPGLDIDGERGDEVIAPANGTIIKAGWTGGYGNMIEIDHGNGLTTRYGHLSKIEVQVGDAINRGQLLGLIGSTGRSTGPHLHYEIRLNDKSINPRLFLPQEPAELKAQNQ